MKKILYFLFVPLFFSCSYIADLKRTGDIITIEHDWDSAPHIEIWAPVRLIPVISNESKIKLIGMDFIVEDYEFKISDDKIVVDHKNRNRLQEEKIADLYIYTRKIERITINSPSKLQSNDTLFFDNLHIVINGKGAYTTGNLILKGNNLRYCAYGSQNKCYQTFSGAVKTAFFQIEGGSKLHAFDLKTINCKVVNKSYIDCYISVSEQLDADIYSSGNIYYKGNPTVIFQNIENNLMNSTGKIFQVE